MNYIQEVSIEEVEVLVESLLQEGYTEQEILSELERKGIGVAITSKVLQGVAHAAKKTYQFGRATRQFVNRGVKDAKLVKDIDKTARTLRNVNTSKKTNTFKGFKARAGAIVNRVKGKLNRTDIKANTPSVTKKPVEVLGGAATTKGGSKTMKNVTPKRTQIGAGIKKVTDTIKTTGTNVAKTGTNAAKTPVAKVTNSGKKEVTPKKNPVVKKVDSDRARSVDRAYGAQIAQTRKLKGNAAADKQRNKFINRAITSKEMDESVKDELLSSARKKHKKAKSFKQWRKDSEQKPLRKGEVRKLVNGKWVSNKKEEVEHIDEKKKGLWDNIHAKRKRGEPPAKKGDKDYPKTLNVEAKTAAWQRKEGKNKKGGLNEKGRKSYERENPGSDLKAPQPGGGPRKRSFCARMGGVKGPMKKPDGSPTRKALALRKWKC